MKMLIIQGHPDQESFTHANAMNFAAVAKEKGHEVQIVDLATADFDSVLRYGYRQHMEDESFPKAVQEKIAWADRISFFFPVWWSAEPSVLKGMIDRVFTPGFAYNRRNGKIVKHLTGKKADVFTSSNFGGWYYKMFGNVVSRYKLGIFAYTGIKLNKAYVLGHMDSGVTQKDREAYIEKCAATID
ncbi:Putative NADPH-quinone reductase (modulator of drug activity B) (MdaB) [Fructobacillus tropaeoli]|uniref:NAD(P)H-dependent oxidoreductase n=1 Tax=Fructobacillus tropaeoli TaxID=709323 RepID=UPI002D860388|nr:Putative NADPH-quinone reductase (modulator of drug activity B) (MdaB) [Fructobacillus tropaeoli]CAK1245991.1 Putative NADPH-quinone reductase (modulator of drug activity B) (MdaB) [Fructobacillus tropaeoli]